MIIKGTLFFIVDILYDKKENATIIIKYTKITQLMLSLNLRVIIV
ncbi:hypothetical protein LPICM02_220073 [Pseudolactococcus piscium]|nr:hypothetical protein LPICM02_220073 [Lactococcus piscium]